MNDVNISHIVGKEKDTELTHYRANTELLKESLSSTASQSPNIPIDIWNISWHWPRTHEDSTRYA